MVYVPAPDDPSKAQAGAFSLRVVAHTSDGGAPLLDTHGAWTEQGRATQYSNPQHVQPGKRVTYVLQLDRVKDLPQGLAAIEVDCVNPAGRVVRRAQADVQR